MCTALENLKNEGRLEGLEEGIQEGIQEGIYIGAASVYRDLNYSENDIILKLQEIFNLSYEEAHISVKREEDIFSRN